MRTTVGVEVKSLSLQSERECIGKTLLRSAILFFLCTCIAYGYTLVEITPSGNILNTKQITTFNYSNGVLTVVVDTIYKQGFE